MPEMFRLNRDARPAALRDMGAGRASEVDEARAVRRPLRVLVAHNVPRARDGGMSRLMGFIHDYAEQAGHQVDYLCADDVPVRLRGPVSRFAFPLLVLRQAARAAKRGEPYDVVNVHELQSAAISVLRKIAGNPAVVVTSYGIEKRAWRLALEELRLGRQGPSLKSRIIHPLTTLWQSGVGLRHADHVICSNSEDRAYLIERLGVPATRITRMHSAAGALFGEAGEGRNYERCERLLFAATWRKNKGVEDLVPAFAELARRHPQLHLTVLGAGMPEALVLEAFPNHLRSRIRYARTSDDAETAAEFAAADIFLLPSLFEGTPLTLIEAMASGLPVVTTATCGMRDVIRDGETGLLVPIRSPEEIIKAVERLLGDRDLRERLGRAARAEALEKYTWERVAEPIGEAYEQLCASGRR